MRKRQRRTRLGPEYGPSTGDEARVEALWQVAFDRGAVAKGCWLPPGNPAPREPLGGARPVISRHTDFAAWFVGEG